MNNNKSNKINSIHVHCAYSGGARATVLRPPPTTLGYFVKILQKEFFIFLCF